MVLSRLRIAALLTTGLAAASCQTTPPATSAPATTTTPAPATTPPAPLRNTRWVLRQLNGQPVSPPAESREPYLLLRETELRAEGNGSCNRFSGTFELPATGQLRFGPLLSTRMACVDPAGTATETGFTRALEVTRTYQISGDTLRLFADAATSPTAVLHAVYLR
jgi:heat shock protein HslJ